MNLNEEPSNPDIILNSEDSKDQEEEFPADPDQIDRNFVLKAGKVKTNMDEKLTWDLDESIILHDPKRCSKCKIKHPGVLLSALLKENGGNCPNKKCKKAFTAAEDDEELVEIRELLDKTDIECSECEDDVPFNQLIKHKFQHRLKALACKHCGCQIKGQKNQIEHNQVCGEQEIVCGCGVPYKRKTRDTHACGRPANNIHIHDPAGRIAKLG